MTSATFNFEQSSLVHQLTIGSFLFFLNVVGHIVDQLIHAGIIAQIVLGMIYGPPLGNIIPVDWLQTFQDLGNLGLVLLVFHGGLSTRLDLLRQNLILSITAALVGIILPIGLSLLAFTLIFHHTALQGFTAGAALCSTSLGTTFAVLSSLTGEIDLRRTRIGTVLLSAAILDDVVGLIMASVVARVTSGTNPSSRSNLAWIILQPVVASAVMAAITPPIAKWGIRPLYVGSMKRSVSTKRDTILLVLLVLLLGAMLTISHYTGSSTLLGAFVAGCTLRYLDLSAPNPSDHSFESVYTRYIETCNERLLVPLFFSSIGAAIPFSDLWKPPVLWKGILYSLLMVIGKTATGLCVLFWPATGPPILADQSNALPEFAQDCAVENNDTRGALIEIPRRSNIALPTVTKKPDGHESHESTPQTSRRKLAVYPALFLACAMVARGEIALLVAQIGRSVMGEEVYLIVMWATVVCTLAGPIGTGWLVYRRLNRCVEGGWN